MYKSAFTLLEIMVAVSIMVIFTVVSLVGYKDFVSKSALRSITYNYVSFPRLAQTYATGSVNIEASVEQDVILVWPVVDGQPEAQKLYIAPRDISTGNLPFYSIIERNIAATDMDPVIDINTLLTDENLIDTQPIPDSVNIFASACLLEWVTTTPLPPPTTTGSDTLKYCIYGSASDGESDFPETIENFTLFIVFADGGYDINIFAIPHSSATPREYDYVNTLGAGDPPKDIGARWFLYTKDENDQLFLFNYVEITEVGDISII